MSGTPGIQGASDVSLLQQGAVAPEPTEKAQNPQRLNRSSIESMKGVQPQLASSESEVKNTALTSRKVSRVPADQLEPKLSGTRPGSSSRQLEIRGNEIKVLQKFLALDKEKPTTKAGFDQQIREWENGISVVKKIQKEAVKQASSGDSKLAVAEITNTAPEALTPSEVQAQNQKEEVAFLLNQFKDRLGKTKQVKKEFEETSKATKKLDAELTKLEAKLSKAAEVFTKKTTQGTGKQHQQQVKELETELASVKKALKDAGKLQKQAISEEKKHAGATPGNFEQRLQKLKHQAGVIQNLGPKAIGKAKVARDHVLQNEAKVKQQQKEARQAEIKAKKQFRTETREMNKAINKTLKQDVTQDRQIQKKHGQAGDRLKGSHRSSDLTRTKAGSFRNPPRTTQKPSNPPRSRAPDGIPEARKKTTQQARDHFKGIKAEPGKKFDQLAEQLRSIKSINDLKQVVADRRSTKITPDQQVKYLGLLKSAVRGMAKNARFAEKLTPDLIRNVLKEQPDEARAAIKLMHKTQAENLEKRFNQLRKQ